MAYFRPLALFAALPVVVFSGCTDDSTSLTPAVDGGNIPYEAGGDGGSDGPAPAPDHECARYTPESSTQTIGGTWASQGASNTHDITVPNEAGGGIVELSIQGAPAGPKLEALVKGVTPAIIGSAAAGDATATGLSFEVAGGQSIEIHAISDRNATADQYPLAYTITWKYTGRADCYEPNETREEAKLVPLNVELEAFALDNRKTNYHVAAEHFDWYRFELKEPKKVVFELLSVPSDVAISIHTSDATKKALPGSIAQPMGQPHAANMGDLPPGVYFVHVEIADLSAPIGAYQQAAPDHFATPYKFRVRAE